MTQNLNIYDNVQRFIVGKENAHAAAVLHDSVVMEIQFVHCVVGSLVVRAGLWVLGNSSGSQHSKAKLASSSHALQDKLHGVRLCGFHSLHGKTCTATEDLAFSLSNKHVALAHWHFAFKSSVFIQAHAVSRRFSVEPGAS